MQPTGLPADAQARFVEAAPARRRHAFAKGAIDRLQRFGLGSNPTGHARPAGRRRVKSLAALRNALFGDLLLRVEVDRRRLDALAILGRRDDAIGEGRARLTPTARQAWIKARCSVTGSRRSGRSNTCRFS